MIRRTLSVAKIFTKLPVNASSSKGKMHHTTTPSLENNLLRWVCEENNEVLFLNSAVIWLKGEQLFETSTACSPKNNLKFSKDWLNRFKERFDLRFRRVYSKAISVEDDTMQHKMPNLLHIILTYPLIDIWNIDQLSVFYCQPRSWTILHGPVSDFKKEKARVSFLAYFNNNRSENSLLMIKDKANKPHYVECKTSSKLEFDYRLTCEA